MSKPESNNEGGALFTKSQLLNSEKFRNRRDLVNAVLDDKQYTAEEAEKLINNYLKGKVI